MTHPAQVENVTDKRLCWLIAREQLAVQARKPGAFGWLTVVIGLVAAATSLGRARSVRAGRGMRAERARDRMADYSLAVDDAAERLSAEERRHLRATRELPEWFMPDVERRFAAIRKAG